MATALSERVMHSDFALLTVLPFLYVHLHLLLVSRAWRDLIERMLPGEVRALCNLAQAPAVTASMLAGVFFPAVRRYARAPKKVGFYAYANNRVNMVHTISSLVYNGCVQRAQHNLSSNMLDMYRSLVKDSLRFYVDQQPVLTQVLAEDQAGGGGGGCRGRGRGRGGGEASRSSLHNNSSSSAADRQDKDDEHAASWKLLSAVRAVDIAIRDEFSVSAVRSVGVCFQYLERYYMKHNSLGDLSTIRSEEFARLGDAHPVLREALDRWAFGLVERMRTERAERVQLLYSVVQSDSALALCGRHGRFGSVAAVLRTRAEEEGFFSSATAAAPNNDASSSSSSSSSPSTVTLLLTNAQEDEISLIIPHTHAIFRVSEHFRGLGLANGDVSRVDLRSIGAVGTEAFKRVLACIEWCELHEGEHGPVPELVKPLRRGSIAECLILQDYPAALAHEYAAFVVDISQEMLFEIVLASNKLGLTNMLNLACAQIAAMIKGKTPEEIRQTFNIVNDFTPEEEAQMRDENQWAEEA